MNSIAMLTHCGYHQWDYQPTASCIHHPQSVVYYWGSEAYWCAEGQHQAVLGTKPPCPACSDEAHGSRMGEGSPYIIGTT